MTTRGTCRASCFGTLRMRSGAQGCRRDSNQILVAVWRMACEASAAATDSCGMYGILLMKERYRLLEMRKASGRIRRGETGGFRRCCAARSSRSSGDKRETGSITVSVEARRARRLGIYLLRVFLHTLILIRWAGYPRPRLLSLRSSGVHRQRGVTTVVMVSGLFFLLGFV